MHTWETIEESVNSLVERMAVPNGWLYRIRTRGRYVGEYTTWRVETVFVPAPV